MQEACMMEHLFQPMYGSETLVFLGPGETKLRAVKINSLQSIDGIRGRYRIKNEYVKKTSCEINKKTNGQHPSFNRYLIRLM